MQSLLRQLLTLVVVVAMLPGVQVLVETVDHLLHDGHLPHSEQHEVDQQTEAHQGVDDEHGCTPIQHRCGCHASAPAILTGLALCLPPRSTSVEVRPSWSEDTPTTRANAPPTRPPIA